MRKHRIDGNTSSTPKEQGIPKEILQKVDTYRRVKNEIEEKEKIFKEQMNGLVKQEADLKREILAFGAEKGVESISTGSTILEFTPRTTRTIDPKEFLKFLKAINKTKMFYDLCSVSLTNTIKYFGETVLISSNVLQSSTKNYSGIKVRPE